MCLGANTDSDDMTTLWRVLAAILHTGRVSMSEKDSDEGTVAAISSDKLSTLSLKYAAGLLGITAADLANLLTTREMILPDGDPISIKLKPQEVHRDCTHATLHRARARARASSISDL